MNVIAAIHQMSSEELNSVVEAVKLRRTALARTSVRKLSVGDLVKFQGRGGATVRGSVLKLNRKTAVVDCGASGRWRVTASMLESV